MAVTNEWGTHIGSWSFKDKELYLDKWDSLLTRQITKHDFNKLQQQLFLNDTKKKSLLQYAKTSHNTRIHVVRSTAVIIIIFIF
jgi:hypothetical protein